MTRLDTLDLAGDWIRDLIDPVTDDDWTRPTPCDAWTVGQLVDHVIGGNRFTIRILGGASATDAMEAALAGFAGITNRTSALTESITEQAALFREPGALARVCRHVAGEMPGGAVLGLRLTDLTIHGWDLARGIGADDTIPPPLVDAVWAEVSHSIDRMARSGRFGTGPSGTIDDDADLQTRLLDATGRSVGDTRD